MIRLRAAGQLVLDVAVWLGVYAHGAGSLLLEHRQAQAADPCPTCGRTGSSAMTRRRLRRAALLALAGLAYLAVITAATIYAAANGITP